MNSIFQSKLITNILNADKLPTFDFNVKIEQKTLVSFGVMLLIVGISLILVEKTVSKY